MPSSPAPNSALEQRLYSATELSRREVGQLTAMHHVVDALATGISIREAGETLGMDKNKVFRLKQRAKRSGLIADCVSRPGRRRGSPEAQRTG